MGEAWGQDLDSGSPPEERSREPGQQWMCTQHRPESRPEVDRMGTSQGGDRVGIPVLRSAKRGPRDDLGVPQGLTHTLLLPPSSRISSALGKDDSRP